MQVVINIILAAIDKYGVAQVVINIISCRSSNIKNLF
jgi:hypothetical protein